MIYVHLSKSQRDCDGNKKKLCRSVGGSFEKINVWLSSTYQL